MENKQVDISYTFSSPVGDVFDAWINPVFVPQWFAPHGCTIKFKKLDIRKDGSYHFCISNPKSGDCWVIGTYREIVPMKKIVFTMINANEAGVPIDPTEIGMPADWPGDTLVTVTFSESNGKTTVNLKQTAPEVVAKRTGAFQSWLGMFERLQKTIDVYLIQKP